MGEFSTSDEVEIHRFRNVLDNGDFACLLILANSEDLFKHYPACYSIWCKFTLPYFFQFIMLRPTGLPAVLRALSKSRGASGRNRVVSSQLFLQPNRRFFFKNDNDDGNNKGSKGGSGKKNDTKGTDNKNKIDDKSIDKGKNDVDKGDTSSGSANFNAKNGGFAAVSAYF